ncbi:MAG TPA: hypothetical protein VFK05_34850 [Polyangiaceae bacterium]|nr:hypothetical protein [Polyangiaceae bacterium]
MIRSGFLRVFGAAFLCCAAGTLAGCSATPNARETVEQSGTLSLPLSVSVGDHLYRFRYFQAYVYPYGAFLSASGDPSETVLKAQLPTGHYQLSLWNWALDRDDGLGNFVPVQADLVSSSSVNFEVLNGSTTTVSYQFETDGQIITVGAGSLNVAARISERAPVCAPLGTDCGEGQWCPPGELTGSPLACHYAGTVALGATCSSPFDCVANSSCIDFGAGPVCAALCSSADLDSTCPDGGTCTAAGRDYGVCTPSPSE